MGDRKGDKGYLKQSEIIFFLSFQAPIQRFLLGFVFIHNFQFSFLVGPRLHHSGGQELVLGKVMRGPSAAVQAAGRSKILYLCNNSVIAPAGLQL